MPKSILRAALIATGLLASTLLPGCARPTTDHSPAAVAVPVADLPPTELTRCAARPDGFPTDAETVAAMPPSVRAAAIRVAAAFRANADQLDRLISWSYPGACPPAPERTREPAP